MKNLIASAIVAVAAIASATTAFAGQKAVWAENPGWFSSQAMYGPNNPVEFNGSAARAAACAYSPTFTLGGKAHPCGDALTVKIAAGGCRGKATGKADSHGYHMVLCTKAQFPTVINGVTFIEKDGTVALR